jgi:hypothetical protein
LIFGAVGFIFSRYLRLFLCIRSSHFCFACCICLCYASVGSLFSFIISFSCMDLSTFCFNTVLSNITNALHLSALVIVRLFCFGVFFIWFILYWCLLCIVLCLLDSPICFMYRIVSIRFPYLFDHFGRYLPECVLHVSL